MLTLSILSRAFLSKNLRWARSTPFSSSAPHFSIKSSLTRTPHEPNSNYFPTSSPRFLKTNNSDWFAPFCYAKPKGRTRRSSDWFVPPPEISDEFDPTLKNNSRNTRFPTNSTLLLKTNKNKQIPTNSTPLRKISLEIVITLKLKLRVITTDLIFDKMFQIPGTFSGNGITKY